MAFRLSYFKVGKNLITSLCSIFFQLIGCFLQCSVNLITSIRLRFFFFDALSLFDANFFCFLLFSLYFYGHYFALQKLSGLRKFGEGGGGETALQLSSEQIFHLNFAIHRTTDLLQMCHLRKSCKPLYCYCQPVWALFNSPNVPLCNREGVEIYSNAL